MKQQAFDVVLNDVKYFNSLTGIKFKMDLIDFGKIIKSDQNLKLKLENIKTLICRVKSR
jgi:hypothetical protein